MPTGGSFPSVFSTAWWFHIDCARSRKGWRCRIGARGLPPSRWLGCLLALMQPRRRRSLRAMFPPCSGPLADLDPGLPENWKDYEFLIVEFRSSSSQRFELGLVGESGSVSKRIHPLANVWVRASIPLRFYRQGLGDADELASTVNQPRNSYWINIEAGGHGPIGACVPSASPCAIRRPRPASKFAKSSLSKTDAGDAVLDGGTPAHRRLRAVRACRLAGQGTQLAGAGARMERRTAHARAAQRRHRLSLWRLCRG